jgi:hypothetical protein
MQGTGGPYSAQRSSLQAYSLEGMCKTAVLQVTFCTALPRGNELGNITQLQGCNVLRKNILYKKLKLHTKH